MTEITQRNSLTLISRHRSHLMGIASMWVVAFHILLFGRVSILPVLDEVFRYGYAGVDIFLLLSGFGLYYSSLKNETIATFYQKRLLRIYPSYVIAVLLNFVLIHFIFGKPTIGTVDFILQLLTLDFWIDGCLLFWYVPAIITIYMLFPFYIKLFDKSPLVVTIMGIATSGVFTVLLLLSGKFGYLLFIVPRVSIFVLGVYWGFLSTSRKGSGHGLKYFCMLAALPGIVFLFLNNLGYSLSGGRVEGLIYSFLFFTVIPGVVIVTSEILERFMKFKVVNKSLVFVGSISLELYLVHMFLFKSFEGLLNIMGTSRGLTSFILVCLSILVAFGILKFSLWINRRCFQM